MGAVAQTSAIQWTDATWNPVTGCSKVSPGCLGAHCYAEALTERFAGRKGYIAEHRPWTPENAEHNVTLWPDRLKTPLRWRSPRMVFVNSMSDLFHENIPIEFLGRIFNVMGSARQHVFQVLTKRPEEALSRLRAYYSVIGSTYTPLPNVWLGVSIENARYTWRADVLREIPAAVRFISAEPLLGSLYPTGGNHADQFTESEVLQGRPRVEAPLDVLATTPAGRASPAPRKAPLDLTGIDWLIVGGESGGRDARPMHPEWARELRDACLRDAGGLCENPRTGERYRPAFFFKQWGSWSPDRPKHVKEHGVASAHPDGTVTTVHGPDPTRFFESTSVYYHGAGPKSGGRILDGREWNEMPTTERRT